jgi:hypothetical protein
MNGAGNQTSSLFQPENGSLWLVIIENYGLWKPDGYPGSCAGAEDWDFEFPNSKFLIY